MDGWIDGWMDGWDGWMDGWMDGWIDGWINGWCWGRAHEQGTKQQFKIVYNDKTSNKSLTSKLRKLELLHKNKTISNPDNKTSRAVSIVAGQPLRYMKIIR